VIDKTIAHIESNRQVYVDRLKELLRIPSISTELDHKSDMHRAAQWIQECLADCGFESEIVKTPGHPAIIADSGPPSSEGPTVLIYGHYDVQPVGDESLWHSPPFEPTVRDGAMYARGSADDKGQVLTHVFAAGSWMKTAGKLPIRVKFIIEGEEEIGSPSLEEVIRKYRNRLTCDYVALSDTPKFNADTPAITYGTKGLIYKEITLCGPKQNLHSGSYGGTLTNPGNALAAIIASLRDADRRVTIPGFYDDVRELTDEERAAMKQLPFDEEGYRTVMGVPVLDGEEGYTTLERRWARPTLDVNGLLAGFTGKGASTVIPAQAVAKVSMRIVPDQDPERISEAFDRAVRAAVPGGVTLDIATHAMCGAYLASLDSPGIKAAADAIEAGFGKPPVFTREGGSLPILPLFKDVLGADSLLMGFCHPDCNAHGPDEFFGLADFQNGIKTAAYFMERLARS
jgi:acetylornithine deacetylase/succinyl-diaminopimelate desuccinylase-like protein